jgi:exonuclease SbcC
MIYQVEMQNFKQHKNFTATFEAGLNTLQGENGAGKTTVLKAILFSLFGAAAAGAKEHLTSWGETKMLVSTTLLLGNLGEVVIRRGGTKAELWQEDTLLASGQSPVTKMVEEHLGMDAKLFKSMLYAGQGETQLLLTKVSEFVFSRIAVVHS